MRAQETLYFLALNSLSDLLPAGGTPAELTLVEQHDPAVIRRVTVGIGAPYDWPSQHYDDEQWTAYLRRPDVRHWTAHLGEDVIGLASLRLETDEVELDTFGLLPEYVGLGLGGAFLTLVAHLAWQQVPAARRLWLHTSSEDHPAALPNYERRGFRRYQPSDDDLV